jgi:hypothetical protein
VTYEIIIIIISHFGLSWVKSRQVVDLFVCWWIVGSTQCVVVWKMCLFAVCGVF